jgi:hypothetical protein
MEKLFLVKKEIYAISNEVLWFATTENGQVPERFYSAPDRNGDFTLIQLHPVLNVEGIEYWINDISFEEVLVEILDDFKPNVPKDCRWFVDKKVVVAR